MYLLCRIRRRIYWESGLRLGLPLIILPHTNILICICLAKDSKVCTHTHTLCCGAIWMFCGRSIKNSGNAKDRPANYAAGLNKRGQRTLIRTVCATGGRQLERKHKNVKQKLKLRSMSSGNCAQERAYSRPCSSYRPSPNLSPASLP